MIRLPPQTPRPILGSRRAEELRARSRAFFARPLKQRAQQRPCVDYRFLNSSEVKEALWVLVPGECAYCESRLETSMPLDVDLFCPRAKEDTPNPALDAIIEQEVAKVKGLIEPDQPYSTMACQLIEPFLKTGAQ